jgi:hypothetical protein
MQRPGMELFMKKQGKQTRYPGIQGLGNGSYRLRIKWRDPRTGKTKEVDRVAHALGSPAEAARRRGTLRAELEAGEQETKQGTRVKDYARSWLSSKLPALKPSTAQRYAQSLDLHILPALGPMLIDAVEPRDIVAFRDTMQRTGDYKPATINGSLRVLRTMFRDAVAELNLTRDPTLRVRALSDARPDDDPNCLTGKELATLGRHRP